MKSHQTEIQVRSLRAEVATLEVASGEAQRRVQAAQEAATAAGHRLQEAEDSAAAELAAALQEHAAEETDLRRRLDVAEEQVQVEDSQQPQSWPFMSWLHPWQWHWATMHRRLGYFVAGP